MRSGRVKSSQVIFIASQLTVALLLAWLVNLFLDSAITHVKENRLAQLTESGISDLSAEVAILKRRVSELRTKTEKRIGTQYPTVQEFKDLAVLHHVRMAKAERQTQAAKSEAVKQTYAIICLGSLEDQVSFLKELEASFILLSDNIVLQRYNDEGTVLALGLSLTVREP